jgi:hypothetical protein
MTDALEGERTLTMMVPPLYATRGSTGWPGTPGWVGTDINDILMFESYFDTSGYNRDSLTLFPIASALQDPGSYEAQQPGGQTPMRVLDIISQVRLNITDVETWVGLNSMPGMIGTDVDFTQIIWGQYRTMLGQASFQDATSEFLTANAGLFGSGSPSTAQKLYCYRFVVLQNSQENDVVSVPASRFILSAIIGKEKDLPYIMRQKRSYELEGAQ